MAAERRRLRRLRSVRARVTTLATVVVVVVLVATAVAMLRVQDDQLTESLDDSLEQRLADLTTVEQAGGDLVRTIGSSFDDDRFAQLVSADGEVVAASPSIRGFPALAPPEGRSARRVVDDPESPSRARVHSLRLDSGQVVHVGSSVEDLEDANRALALSFTIATPLIALLMAGLVWWLVGRTLRPVEAIRSEVASLGATDLGRRVPEPGTGDEIDRLARTMNQMLDRIEDATDRQRRFVADASHELRTPLTRMRAELEVDLADPGPASLEATHRSVLDETIGMQRMVEDLLHLARADAGKAPTRTVALDLDDIVMAEVAHYRDQADVDTSGVSAATVAGDADQLARAVRNLVDNAVRHAASKVTISTREIDAEVELEVHDDGPGIAPERAAAVFERFGRADEARGRHEGGTGLGLAITADIVERHGGRVELVTDGRPGTRFVVRLPRLDG